MASSGRGRPVTVDVDAILDVAAALAATDGLVEHSVTDVAERAGVSRRTMYRYFGGRDGLLLALLTRERDRFLADAEAAIDAAVDGRTALADVLACLLERSMSSPVMEALRASDPGVFYSAVSAGTGVVFDVAWSTTQAFLDRFFPGIAVDRRSAAAEIITRVAVSMIADPPRASLDVVEPVARFVHAALVAEDATSPGETE